MGPSREERVADEDKKVPSREKVEEAALQVVKMRMRKR